MDVLHENVMNLIILETLKVLFSNILLKKYHSSMRCGLDEKNWPIIDFRLAILLTDLALWPDQSPKENMIKV